MEKQILNQRDDDEYESETSMIHSSLTDAQNQQKYNSQISLQNEKLNSIFESGSNQKDNVKVCIRIRPINEREKFSQIGKQFCIQQLDQQTLILDRITDQKTFNFDFVGNDQIDQNTIFNHIAKPIADSCMQGYNGTIFAYGQTGAGKTYTIQGPQIDLNDGALDQSINSKKNQENYGIIQRSFDYIFQNIQAQQKLVSQNADGSELTYLIKCSYLEIYNEQIMDLLEPSSINLGVREDIKKGVYVEGLKEEVVTSYKDMIQLILRGAKNRHVGATSMNRESSRSHSVLTTIIESKSMSQTGVWNMRTSRFHIIDLAGSERSKVTNAVGERLKEAGMINKSLSALGNVINSLVDLSEGKNRHVPYRDSKLTFILRDSLGGNSKTVIIANISPSSMNVSETLSTLEFAKRAKQIKNKAVVNEDSSGTILILKNEIKRLKKEMMEQNKNVQKMIQQQMQTNEKDSTEQVCKICKMNSIIDSAIDDENIQNGDDSLLLNDEIYIEENDVNQKNNSANDSVRDSLEFRQGLIKLKKEMPQGQNQFKKFRIKIYHLHERIKIAEALFQQNIDLVTSQKTHYENEIQDLKEQLQKQTQASEALQQQTSRDIMKMKLREHKIQKLEQDHQINYNEECIQLQNEIKILHEQLAAEREDQHNPKISQLKAQVQELQVQIKKKQIQIVEIPQLNIQDDTQIQLSQQQQQKVLSHIQQQQLIDTIVPQYMSEQESLLQQLKSYLKDQCSLEQQQIQNKKLFQIQKDLQNYINDNKKFKSQNEDLQQQYDILLQQNVEAEEINQRITRELARTNVELDSALSRFKEQQMECASLNQIIKVNDEEFQKQNGIIRQQSAGFENELKGVKDFSLNLQKQYDDLKFKYQNEVEESQNLKIQIEQQKEQISLKIQVIDQKQEIIEEKQESIQWQKAEIQKLNSKLEKLQQTHDQKVQDYQNLKQESEQTQKKLEMEAESLKKKQNQEIEDQRHIGENLIIQIEQVNSEKSKIALEKKQALLKIDQLNEDIQVLKSQINDLLFAQNEISQKLEISEFSNSQKDEDMKLFKQDLLKFQDNQKQVEDNFNKSIKDLQNQKLIQENNFSMNEQKYKNKIQQQNQQIEQLNNQIQNENTKQIEIDQQLKNQIDTIIQQHNLQIQDYENQVQGLNDQIESLIDEKNNDCLVFDDKINQITLKNQKDQQKLADRFQSEFQQIQQISQNQIDNFEIQKQQILNEQKKIQADICQELENTQNQNQQLLKELEEKSILYCNQIQDLNQKNNGLLQKLQEENEKIKTQEIQNEKEIKKSKEKQMELLQMYEQQITLQQNTINDLQSQQNDEFQNLFEKNQILEQQLQLKDNDHQNEIQNFQNQFNNLNVQLQEQNKNEQIKLQNQYEKQKQNLQLQIEQKKQESEKLKFEIEEMSQAHKNQIQNFENLQKQLEQQLRESILNINEDTQNLQEKLDQLLSEREQLIENLERLENQNNQYQNNISYLDVSVEQMNNNIKQKDLNLNHLQAENQELLKQLNIFNDKINDMHDEYQLEKNQFLENIQDYQIKTQKLEDEIKYFKEQLNKKNEVTDGQDKEQAESQILLLEAQKIINEKDEELQIFQQKIQQYLMHFEQIQNEKYLLEQQTNQAQQILEETMSNIQNQEIQYQQELNEKQQEIQRLESEKDALQFKRDENIKNLEGKIKDYKSQIKSLEQKKEEIQNEKQNLNSEAEKEINSMRELMDSIKKVDIQNLKNQIQKLSQEKEDLKKQSDKDLSDLKDQNNKIIDQFHKDSQKLNSQIQEIVKMQAYIEDLQNQVNDLKKIIESIKKDCYDRNKFVQNLFKDENIDGDDQDKSLIDQQKQKIKDAISEGLQQISDVDKMYGSQKQNFNEKQQASQIEISLLISQTVCEFSKLYEKQIVLEKKKASTDFKKYSDQYQKLKQEIHQLKELNKKLTEDMKQNLLKQLDEKNQNDVIIIKQLNEQCENLTKEWENLHSDLQQSQTQLQQSQKMYQETQEQLNGCKKQMYDQKQLYEVRVQSQEQEIEQHQFRYRELELELNQQVQQQEEKFQQVQNQVQQLAMTTKQAQIQKNDVLQEIKIMQTSVENAQKTDEEQREQIKFLEQKNNNLMQKIKQRENEMGDAVKSLKQFADLKKTMEREIEILKIENEQLMGGHRNPNQKIQFHLKIKEENNKLREENSKLQEDLQKKHEILSKLQNNKDGTPQKQVDRQFFQQLLDHILNLQHIQMIALNQQMVFDLSNNQNPSYQTLQQAIELMNIVNQTLKEQYNFINQIKEEPFDKYSQQSKSQSSSFKGGIPPRHNAQPFSSANQNLQISKSSSILTQKNDNQQINKNQQYNSNEEYSSISRAQSISQINQIIYTNRGTSQKNVPFHSSSKKQIGQIQASQVSYGQNVEDIHSQSSFNKNNNSVSSSENRQIAKQQSTITVSEPQQRQIKAMNQNFIPSTQINIQQLLRAGSSSSSSKKLMQQQLNSLQQQQTMIQQQDSKNQRKTSAKAHQQALAETVILNSYSNVHGKQISQNNHIMIDSTNAGNRIKGPQIQNENENETLFQKFSQMDQQQITNSMHQSASKPQFNPMQQQQIVMMASGPVIVSTPTSNSGYSNINTKHKQYKQAQSQKGSLISQRSKSRANNPPVGNQPLSQSNSSNQQQIQKQYQMNDFQ